MTDREQEAGGSATPGSGSREVVLPEPPDLPRRLEYAAWPRLEPESGFQGKRFEGMVWSGGSVPYLRFRGCRLTAVRMDETEWLQPWLTDVVLEDCTLSGARWTDTVLTRVQFVRCRISGWNPGERVRFQDVSFQECQADLVTMRGLRARRVRFDQCRLRGSDFTMGRWQESALAGCDLDEADFSGARLAGCDLRGSALSRVRIGPQEVRGAIVDTLQGLLLAQGLLGLDVRDPRGSGTT